MSALFESLGDAKERRAKLALAVLLVGLALWYFGVPLVERWLDLTQLESLARGADARTLDGKDLIQVRLAELTNHLVVGYQPDRNIFRFGPEPAPPYVPPPPPVYKPPPPPVDPGPRQPVEPQPPPVPYELIGIFGPKTRRIAVLAEGREIQNALVGDVLRNAFVVRDIGYQTVEFGFIGFPDDRRARIEMGSN